LNICFIIPSLAAGGAENVTLLLYYGIKKRYPQANLIIINNSGKLSSRIQYDESVKIIGKNRLISSIPDIISHIRKIRPDVIFSSLWHLNVALIAFSFRYPNTKVLVREANYPNISLGSLKFPKLFGFLYRRYYPRADCIIASSELMKKEIQEFCRYNGDNISVMPNPVDEEKIRLAAIKLHQVDVDTINFVAVGRLTFQKGFDRLISLFAQCDNATLIIIGSGNDRELLENLICKLKLNERVKLGGESQNPWSYIASADALLLPSRWEGLPNVVLEALACGTPVIATPESGAIREIKNALKNQNSVHIVKFEDDFFDEMQKVKRRNITELGVSLLPEKYKIENVIILFEKLAKKIINE